MTKCKGEPRLRDRIGTERTGGRHCAGAGGAGVEVFEAEAQPGGAARTLELTLPGFLHDFGSAVHPFAASSPFFTSLPLGGHGLEWIHGEAPLAHPLDDGSAVILERDLAHAERALGADGKPWRSLVAACGADWQEFAEDRWRRRCAFRIIRCAWRDSGSRRFNRRKLCQSHFFSARTRAVSLGWRGTRF